MSDKLSGRERLLAAIDGARGAPIPCCFMIFRALRTKCRDEFEFVNRQQEMGLEARVQLEDIAVRFSPEARVREWAEPAQGGAGGILHRAYETPAGALTASVRRTDDWPHGERVPIFDDYFAPRAVRYLLTAPQPLDALRYILVEPTADDIAVFRAQASARKRFAAERGLALTGGWKSQRFVEGEDTGLIGDNGGTGSVIDTLMWLCGGTAPLYWAYDEPGFLAELIAIVQDWNRKRLSLHLEVGVDVVMRRAWYEGTEFWSPAFYRRFILPGLKREVEMTHQAAARYAYIITSGMLPIADMLVEAGGDVILGIDPGQGKGTTLQAVRDRMGGRVGLWGGVSGPLTIETGTEADVRRGVEEAIRTLGPAGRFILSPVDNVREDTPQSWRNVEVFIDTWKSLAGSGG